MATTHFHMGTIVRPHGIKGELCVDWYADSPELLRGTIYLQVDKEPMQEVQGAKFRMHKGRVLLTLKHITDRNKAETLRNVRIFVNQKDLPELDDTEMYLQNIIGFSIIQDKIQQKIGILEGVEFPTPEQMLWRIRGLEGQEILFPAVEDFILSFDTDNETIVIDPPEGLVELYLEEKKTTPKKKK